MKALTDGAREELDRYLNDVERSLDGQAEVSAPDVVAGIREHVEAELGSQVEGVATAEDIADVLQRLGPPAAWVEPGSLEAAGAAAGSTRRTAAVALGLVGIGVALVLVNTLTALGWGLVIVGSVAARGGYDAAPGAEMSAESRAALAWARLSTLLGGVAVLLGPALYVWGASQTGGVLETPLERHLDLAGSERPLRFWLAMGALASAATGAWWICAGGLIRHFERPARHLVGPLRDLVSMRSTRRLLLGGVILLALSLLGLFL